MDNWLSRVLAFGMEKDSCLKMQMLSSIKFIKYSNNTILKESLKYLMRSKQKHRLLCKARGTINSILFGIIKVFLHHSQLPYWIEQETYPSEICTFMINIIRSACFQVLWLKIKEAC